ncbi:MAG: hypothetical protein ACI9J3_000038 [Parvicellaceae bacterium]
MRVLLIISFISIGFSSNAQQFFNNTYDWGAVEAGIGMEMIDDTLYTIGWTDDFVKRDLILSKFDTNGNKIVDFTIIDSISLDVGYLGFYVDHEDNIIGYGNVNAIDTIRAFTFKIKKSGELVWSRYYTVNSLQMILLGGCVANDSNYVFCGYQYSPSNGNDFLFLKTDTLGNILDSSTYGGAGADIAFSIVPGVDSGYLMSGYNYSIEPNGNWHLVKVDESGAFEWERDYGTSFGGEIAFVEAGKTGYWCYGLWSTASEYTGQITKLNTNGIIQNQIIFDQTDIYRANLYAGHELDDGSFIAAGTVHPPSLSDPQGWIVKVDSNCNEIWQRRPDKRLNDHYIYDVEELGDSSLLFLGVVFADAGFSQDLWLFRTDYYGCIDLGCNGIGIKEEIANISISAFPNPFSSSTTIQFESEIEIEKVIISDLMGKVILERLVLFREGQIELDLNGFSPGIYLCSFVIGGHKARTVKLMLEP